VERRQGRSSDAAAREVSVGGRVRARPAAARARSRRIRTYTLPLPFYVTHLHVEALLVGGAGGGANRQTVELLLFSATVVTVCSCLAQ